MRYTFPFFLLLVSLIPSAVFGADGELVLVPESGTFPIGQTFQVSVYADPDDVSGKAAEADIRYNQTILEVAAISTAGSVLTLWSEEPTYSNEEGLVRFSGWSNQPFSSNRNLLLTITFRPKTSGTHSVRIESGALLASDGRATNILTRLGNGTYVSEPEAVSISESGGIVLGAETQSDDAPPEVPRINWNQNDIRSGDRLMLSGSGPKNGRVNIWLEKNGEKSVRESVDVSSDGTFVYMSDERLSAGSYLIWFEGYSAYGVLSPATDTRAFTVLPDGADLVAGAALGFLTTPVFMGMLLLVFGFIFGYVGYRFVSVRARS